MVTIPYLGWHGKFRKALQSREFARLPGWVEALDEKVDDHAHRNQSFYSSSWLRRNMRLLASLDQEPHSQDPRIDLQIADFCKRWEIEQYRSVHMVRVPVACVGPNAVCWLRFWGERYLAATSLLAPTPSKILIKLGSSLVNCVHALAIPGWRVL
jgi:hypothetical protein